MVPANSPGRGSQTIPEPGSVPWVLVAGGFHDFGGMDRANAALARFVARRGVPVHLVAYRVDDALAQHANVTVHRVRRPLGSFFLAQPLLDRRGRSVVRRVRKQSPGALVVVNGGNCLAPGATNWVHYVHSAVQERSSGEGRLSRWKSSLSEHVGRRREHAAFANAELIVTNSNRTRLDVIATGAGVDAHRVVTVCLGSDPAHVPPTDFARDEARRKLGISPSAPVALFLGALGHSDRKGLGVLLDAWKDLGANNASGRVLLIAGTGPAEQTWRRHAVELCIESSVRFVGFAKDVLGLFSAADVLVSPVRYEPYGLNVREAICCGLPAIVTATAGVAEHYGPGLQAFLLRSPEDSAELARLLHLWLRDPTGWRAEFAALGESFRRRSWGVMAEEMYDLIANHHGTPRVASSVRGER